MYCCGARLGERRIKFANSHPGKDNQANNCFVGGTSPGEENMIAASSDYGVLVVRASGVVIQRNDIRLANNGIHLSSVSGVLVEDNTLTNCFQAGIFMEGEGDFILRHNTISDSPAEAGIFGFAAVGRFSVFGNEIFQCRRGILLSECSGGEFVENVIHHNEEAGVQAARDGSRNKFSQNVIRHNQGMGISFGDGFAPTPNDLLDGVQNYPELNRALT